MSGFSVPQPHDFRSAGKKFADEEESTRDGQSQKDREDRNIEINSNGVWMVDHQCGLCGNKMLWNGSSTEPRVWCPRCNVQITKEGLVKIFPGMRNDKIII